MKILVLVVLTLAATSLSAAQLYRWVDADGKVHYTDKPPPKEAKDIEKKRVRTAADAIPMPYALQQAAKTFPVTVYNADCGAPCDQAGALIEKRGIPHTARNARDPEVQADLKKLTGSQDVDVPVLQVGRNVVKGWEAGQWNNALDAAGYPKSAVWKQPPAKPENKAAGEAPKAPVEDQAERPAEASAAR
jgi:hypothetical protein